MQDDPLPRSYFSIHSSHSLEVWADNLGLGVTCVGCRLVLTNLMRSQRRLNDASRPCPSAGVFQLLDEAHHVRLSLADQVDTGGPATQLELGLPAADITGEQEDEEYYSEYPEEDF